MLISDESVVCQAGEGLFLDKDVGAVILYAASTDLWIFGPKYE